MESVINSDNKQEREISMSNTVKKTFVLVLIIAVVSFGLVGCKNDNEHPSGDHPTSEQPAEKTASDEHPSNEHPAGETATDEQPTNEHPAGEHPK